MRAVQVADPMEAGVNNRDRVGKGLEYVLSGVAPFVQQTMSQAWGPDWISEKRRRDVDRFGEERRGGYGLSDPRFLLSVMLEHADLFKRNLPYPGLATARNIRDIGHKHSHNLSADAFDDAEASAALDSMATLLSLVKADTEARAVRHLRSGTTPRGDSPPRNDAPPPPRNEPPPFGGAAPPPPGYAPPPGPGSPPPPYGVPPWHAPPAARPGPPPLPVDDTVGGDAGALRKGCLAGVGVSGGLLVGCLAIPVIFIVVIIVIGALAGGCSPSGVATPTGDPTSPVKSLGSTKGVQLAHGYYIDLRQDPAHPKKEPDMPDEDQRKHLDVAVQYGRLATPGTARMAMLASGAKGDYKICRDTTRYEDQIDLTRLPGRLVCVTDADGFTGLLKIKGVRTQPSAYVTFDLTLWRGPKPS